MEAVDHDFDWVAPVVADSHSLDVDAVADY